MKKVFLFNAKAMRKGSFLLLIALWLCHIQGYAQSVVKGKVTDESGNGLPGANVVVKGSGGGTITDVNGGYSVEAASDATLTFSYVGYVTEEVTVNNRSVIDVSLTPDVTSLNEIVVIGYGEQKKKEITGAVTRIGGDKLAQNATADLGTALQGEIAGVNVQLSSGDPGSDANIQIRGLSSVTGANAPLYVVDGVPYPGDPKLSMNEIESIDVLKDAASASIYGTRGSGGVILITTKHGKEGVMKIGIDSYMGVQNITSGEPLLNFEQQLYQDFMVIYNLDPTQTWQNSWTVFESNPANFTNNSDIRDVIQNDNAIIQNHSLSLSGGKQGLTYNFVGNYFGQDGTIINSGYDRINGRMNAGFKNKKWNITTGLGFRVENQEYAPYQFLLDAIKYKPSQQMIDPNASTIADAGNSKDAEQLGNLMAKVKQKDQRDGHHFNGFIQAQYEIIKDLTITSRLGASYTDDTRTRINPLFVTYDDEGNPIAKTGNMRSGVYNQSSEGSSMAWESYVNYRKKFGDHQIKLMADFSMEKYGFSSFYALKKDLISNEVTVLNGATADPDAGSGTGWNQDKTNTLIGMLGRVQYDYKGKYLLSASVRRDGSSRFSKKYRWGVFPSVSAGWMVSSEPFWSGVSRVATSFKIRGSYGTTGNQNFLDYSNAAVINIAKDYAFGPESNPSLALGGIQTNYSNADVKWETSQQMNAGFDLGLFGDKLTISGDFYKTTRQDMLFPLLLPYSTGAGANSTVVLNVGDMENRGMELSANYRHIGNLGWSIRGTFTNNTNEVTKMSGANKISYFANSTVVQGVPNEDLVTAIAEGYPAGAFFLIKTDGLVDTQEELAAYQKIQPTAKMGDLKYVDYNGDSAISRDDRQYMGKGAPDFEFGFGGDINYKGFDLSMSWYAAFGGKIMNGSKAYAYKFGRHMDQLYQWTPWNPNTDIPANRGRDYWNNRGYTDYWLEDGSYVRLKNIALGYTIPSELTNRIGINKFRIYVSAQNALTFTKYTGYDPEVGNDGLSSRGLDRGNYPVSAVYRVGLQFDF